MANYGITEFIGNMQLFIEQLTVFFYQKNQKAMSSQTFSVLLIPRAICRRIFIQGDLEFLQMCHTTYMKRAVKMELTQSIYVHFWFNE